MTEPQMIKKRNPILVFFWTAGITILAQLLIGAILIVTRIFNKSIGGDPIYNAFNTPGSALLTGVLSLFFAIPLFKIIVKFLWRRNLSLMALNFDAKKLFTGFTIGFLLPVLILFILFFTDSVELYFNPFKLSPLHIASAVFGSLALMLFVGYSEEIIFRGMLFREWATGGRIVLPTVVSGLIFGVIHVLNIKNLTPYNVLAITISGLAISSLLTVLYMRFKSLWASIGFHVGWNFVIIAILGTPVSGINTGKSIFITRLKGPIILTGGIFGIEISIVAFIIVLIALGVLLKYPFKEKIEFMNCEITNTEIPKQENIT